MAWLSTSSNCEKLQIRMSTSSPILTLNENPALAEEQAACPTCEMLSAYFYTHISEELKAFDVQLRAVEVELGEPEGKEWGSARIETD